MRGGDMACRWLKPAPDGWPMGSSHAIHCRVAGGQSSLLRGQIAAWARFTKFGRFARPKTKAANDWSIVRDKFR